MSRKIDTSDLSKLSEEDLAYLLERSRITTDQLPAKKADKVATAVAENSGGNEGPGTTVDLNNLSVSKLKAEAKARDLSTGGSKQDLIDRITEHDAGDELVEE